PSEVLRMTVDAKIAGFIATVPIVVDGPLGVVNDPKIQEAVVVVIEPACSHGPFADLDAGFSGDIFEFAVPEIAIENVAVDARNEQVGLSIVIEICSSGSH